MVNGELGRYPLDIDIKVRTISFWAKLISGKQTKLSLYIFCNSVPSEGRLLKKATFGDIDQ
jgi:hypothetical protein